MVPGPTVVPQQVLAAYLTNYGSADIEPEFVQLYEQTGELLQRLLGTRNQIVIKSGEGMIALWGGLKSCLKPGDRVLAVATGVFGYGIADMAAQIGANVRTVGLAYDETLSDLGPIANAITEFQPKMITAVHCETPSGTLNPLAQLGQLKADRGVPLFYVDAVASIGGALVLSDAWHIDLTLGGAQKCLSAPPDMSFLAVSAAAWDVIGDVGYVGYDALLPFRTAAADAYFPYTPCWHGVAALRAAAQLLLDEGLEHSFARHERVKQQCHNGLAKLGIDLFPASGAIASPTVTAAKVPAGWTWPEWDRALRSRGLVTGGAYGPIAGQVFRYGHMGAQADPELMERALAATAAALADK